MAKTVKYPASNALAVIDGDLTRELAIHRFDPPTRTKAHLFAMGGAFGRQFGIVLGNTDVNTGKHPAQQTQILLERCTLPPIPGIEVNAKPYSGHRIKVKQDSKIAAPNQLSVLVSDETALKNLLRWYAHPGS